MPATVTDDRRSTLRELPEKAGRMAQASIRKAENDTDRREEIAVAFDQASEAFSLKELSGMLKRDERQIARWKSGTERVPLDVVLGSEALWPRMLIALARLRPEAAEIETIVRIRRA